MNNNNQSSDNLTQELTKLSSEVKELTQVVCELKKEIINCQELTKQISIDYQFLKPSIDILTIEVNQVCCELQQCIGNLIRERPARPELSPTLTRAQRPGHNLLRIPVNWDRLRPERRLTASPASLAQTTTTDSSSDTEISSSSWDEIY